MARSLEVARGPYFPSALLFSSTFVVPASAVVVVAVEERGCQPIRVFAFSADPRVSAIAEGNIFEDAHHGDLQLPSSTCRLSEPHTRIRANRLGLLSALAILEMAKRAHKRQKTDKHLAKVAEPLGSHLAQSSLLDDAAKDDEERRLRVVGLHRCGQCSLIERCRRRRLACMRLASRRSL